MSEQVGWPSILRSLADEIQSIGGMPPTWDMIPRDAAAEIERLRAALKEIAGLVSHRNPCCPTNPAKRIAIEALSRQEQG